MPSGVHVLQLINVLATTLLLVYTAHMLRLAVCQLIIRYRFFVLKPDRCFVVDVDIALYVTTWRFFWFFWRGLTKTLKRYLATGLHGFVVLLLFHRAQSGTSQRFPFSKYQRRVTFVPLFFQGSGEIAFSVGFTSGKLLVFQLRFGLFFRN
uniref:Uncharacterized protein n=1 Tax=Anopheles darlingi TaxID=43151 RepID=A0A2M4D4X6_ANODA